MSREVLYNLIHQSGYIEVSAINFVWHGGEPLLLDIDFYRDAVVFQCNTRNRSGVRFINSIQTNGTLITDEYVQFFKENDFKVGLSFDGPKEIHDKNRLNKNNKGSYDKVLEGLQMLRSYGIEPGIVAVIDPLNPPVVSQYVDWLDDIQCQSISFSIDFNYHGNSDELSSFFEGLYFEIKARNSKVSVKQFLQYESAKRRLIDDNLFDVCHPGWPCYESISSVDSNGQIFFGCDRFLSHIPEDRDTYKVGDVKYGFKNIKTSGNFQRYKSIADSELKHCNNNCSLYGICKGGCIADWILNKEASLRPNLTICRSIETINNITNILI